MKVQESRGSFWSRIFKRPDAKVGEINDLTFADNEAIQVIASDSGGFRGQYKQLGRSSSCQDLIGVRDD